MNRFMETQVTKRIEWAQLEYKNGETFYCPREDYDPSSREPGMILTFVHGYGVRESAPGYLDCTDWEVYPTLKEAEARAAEIDSTYYDED